MNLFFSFAFFFALTKEYEPAYGTITGCNGTGDYGDVQFLHSHQIPTNEFTYSTTGDQAGHPFSHAIDRDKTTHWAGSVETTNENKNIIEFHFTEMKSIESIVFIAAYSTSGNTRRYDGFPLVLNADTQVDGFDYQLKYQINTNPGNTKWDYVLWKFPKPLTCNKLKLEFVEVTIDQSFGNKYTASLQDIYLLQNISYHHLTVQQATGNYANGDYLDRNYVTRSECSAVITDGDQSGHSVDSIFDRGGVHWAGSKPNTASFKNSLIFEFTKMQFIESIVYFPAYSTDYSANTRRYDGYPIVLNIYTTIDGVNYTLDIVETGRPPSPASPLWDSIHIEFPEPLYCTALKLEFEELTIDQSFGNDYTPSAKYIYLMKAIEETANDFLPRVDIESQVFETAEEVPNFTDDSRIFSGFEGFDCGSAMNIINYNVELERCHFENCSSTVAGGAVYINTGCDIQHSTNFEGSTFTNCSSASGGALCIIARANEDFVSITNCVFTRNSATDGSAIYLSTQSGQVKSCRFSSNSGSSIIKYASDDPASSTSSMLLASSAFIVSDCSFEDDITEGTFYIDVDESINSNRVSLNDNKFAIKDINRAIKINRLPVNQEVKKETKSKSSLFLTILVPTLAVISLLLIIAVINLRKTNNNQSEPQESNTEELSNEA